MRETLLAIVRLEGRLGRAPYALAAPLVFMSQHLMVLGLYGALGQELKRSGWFYVAPLRSIALLRGLPGWVMLLALALMLLIGWLLVVLSFRRATSARYDGWAAAMAFIPGVQLFVFAVLSVAPEREAEEGAVRPRGSGKWVFSAQGVFAGVALTLCAVAVGALVFRTYGYGLFVLSPFVVSAVAGYLANRREDIGASATSAVAMGALLLGGLALVVTALEGVICILMAAPLGAGVGLIGGALGRALAVSGKSSARRSVMGVALLPMVFAAEILLPPSTAFETTQSVTVAAPPSDIWQAVVHMDAILPEPTLPFRLGVAYPMSAVIKGEGVGAERLGVFSTGAAIERVTEWVPGRKLAFEVLSSPPSMHEFSPYEHVHAPHVIGYFDTITTSFDIVPLADGRSKVVLRSAHELKLEPVLYWLPIARWVVAQDNARVLEHIRLKAEA